MKTESNELEYKRELTDGLEREVVAFMNGRNGGVIYIGVNDDGSIAGVDDPDQIQLQIKDRIRNNIAPSMMGLFDVSIEMRDDKPVVKILLAGGIEKPYYLRKYGMSERGCYIRIGSGCEPMPVRLIEDMFARRVRNSLSCIRSPRQDLHFEQLRIYYDEAGLTLPEKFARSLELLTDDGAYNFDAYLLADENANSFMFAKYEGSDRIDLLESKDFGRCCLVKTCKQLLDRLEGVENHVINRITPTIRRDFAYWNSTALREAVINTVIHNDYASPLVPKVEIFQDRLELTSAGSFGDKASQDEFFAGYSIPRNKTIMRVFRDLGMVEQLGSGMPRILSAYDKSQFEFSHRHVRLTMKISEEALREERVAESRGETEKSRGENAKSRGETEKSRGETGKGREKSRGKVLRILEENPRLTVAKIASLVQLSEKGVEKILNQLKDEGSLRRVGPNKGGFWEVLHPHGD